MLNFFLLICNAFSMSTYKPGACYQFLCGSADAIDNLQDPCIIVDHNKKTVTVKLCDKNYQLRCPYFPDYAIPENKWENQTCLNYSTIYSTCDDYGTIQTGQQCCNNKNCISGTCLDGKCIGNSIGDYCEDSTECKADSYCKASECTKTKPLGDACGSDIECSSGLGCNLAKCVQIFSLKPGEETEDEKFCTSNFMAFGVCEILTPKIRGSEGVLFPPFMCLQGQICDLYYSNGTHYGDYECLCAGYNNLVEGFCGYNLLSVEGLMDQVYQELQYTESLCTGSKAHSNNPLDLIECESINKEQFSLYMNIYMQHRFYNIYVTGALDACSDDFGLWDYTYSFRDFQNFGLSLAYVGVFMIFEMF